MSLEALYVLLKKHLFYLKSSEHRAWLLYYSLPIILTYLSSDYVNHFALLISAMLGCNISTHDLSVAEECLFAFYAEVPELYPDTMLTANLHTIVHLCDYWALFGHILLSVLKI